eukprot:gene34171-45826_t
MSDKSTSYFFELFDAALVFHAADLSLSSLTKSPNRTILLKDLATTKDGDFIEELFKFICFVISDNGRELLVSRQCKLKFHHSKADIALTKVLMYADSRCRLPETHGDWVAKCMKFWSKKLESEPSKADPCTSNDLEKSSNRKNTSQNSARGLSPERLKAAAHRKAMSLSRITPEIFDDDMDDNLMAAATPGHKASRSMNAMEMGALRYMVNENSTRRDAECDSPMSHLSYSKAYKQDESPMRPLTSSKKHGNTNNPLLIDPKKVLSQMEEERRNAEQVENEIGELKSRFDATLTDRDAKIDRLSSELESKEAKLSHATSSFRVAQNEKFALEKALAEAKEKNEKLQNAQEKEFSGKKKELLLKASQFKKLSGPVLKDKNSTIEGINESKAALYKSLNLMSAFPFHSENFATANSATKNSVVLQVTYPPDLANQNFNNKNTNNKASSDCQVKSGRKMLAATVEVAPRVVIDSSVAKGHEESTPSTETFYTLILSDLDYVSAANNNV